MIRAAFVRIGVLAYQKKVESFNLWKYRAKTMAGAANRLRMFKAISNSAHILKSILANNANSILRVTSER